MALKSIRNFGLFIGAVLAVANLTAQQKGFKTDATTGVEYRFIKQAKNGTKPTENDFAWVTMLWTGKNAKGDADSVFFDSHKKGDSAGAIIMPLKKTFNGCLEQGVMMMTKGDSAIFHINGDSLFLKTFHAPPGRMPVYITGSTVLTFNVKLLGILNKEEMMAQRKAAKESEVRKNKAKEAGDIKAYLQKNYPAIKPDADSLFYLEVTKGKGAQVQIGDSLEIKYKGMFLDGTVFDQSDKGTGPGTFKVRYNKTMPLIQGWISVLGKMNEGDKVKVLIPSKMAYGPQGRSQIPPYAPLVFEMELIRLKSNK